MHRSLQIPEIVSLIVEKLDELPSAKTADLLAVATTCKGFQDAALDALWESVYDLRQIIQVLPGNLWTETIEDEDLGDGDSISMSIVDFLRTPTSEDLQRYLDVYAHRIRNLSLESDDGTGFTFFSTQAFQLLQFATEFERGVLSPRLQSLSGWMPPFLKPHHDQSFPFLSLFLGRDTRSLTFEFASSSLQPLARATIEYALQKTPSLKDLTLFDMRIWDEISDSHVDDWILGSSWSGLETLCLTTPISTDSLMHLSLLPHLKDFSCTLHTANPTAMNGDFFESLQKLELATNDVGPALGCVRRLSPTNIIKRFKIKVYSPESPKRIEALLEAVVNNLRPAIVKHLDLDVSLEDHSGQPDPSLQVDLSPFLSFHRLRTLCFSQVLSAWLSPDVALRIPSSWPNLKTLILQTDSNMHHPAIDHTHLASIIKGCRTLERVQLQFDASRVPKHGTATSPGPANDSIKRFWVYLPSPITLHQDVLAFFKALFPKHMELVVDTLWGAPPGEWKGVEEGWRDYQKSLDIQ